MAEMPDWTQVEQVRALVEAAKNVLEIAKHADFVSGVCCCGSSLDRGRCFDHPETDTGSYYGGMALEQLREAVEGLNE